MKNKRPKQPLPPAVAVARSLTRQGWTSTLTGKQPVIKWTHPTLSKKGVTAAQAGQIQHEHNVSQKEEEEDLMVHHLTESGWTYSETQGGWQRPHWAKIPVDNEYGYYVARSLRKAFIQQLKLDAAVAPAEAA